MSGFIVVPQTITGSGSTPIGAAGGELSGSYPNPDVSIINGATVPDSGSVPTGNVLQISTTDTLVYGPINLAGGDGYISGLLPLVNQTHQTLSGDLSGTTSSATVIKINGTSVASSPTTNQALISTGSTSSTWSLISDANINSGAAIASTKLGYSDVSSPVLGSTTVQGAIDAIKAVAVATAIQRQSQIINLAALQAAGAIATVTFNIGSALPANARVIGAEINVSQAFSGLGLSVALATVQASSDVAGTLVAGASVLSTGLVGSNGTNQYLSRGSQQITVIVVLTGALFNALTAGSLTANVFYAVIS